MDKAPLVIFSTQAWSELWVSKHWIANEFSRERLVVFVEPPKRISLKSLLSFEIFRSAPRHLTDTLLVFPTYTLPFPYRMPSFIRPLYRHIINFQVRRLLSFLNIQSFDVLNFDCHSYPIIKKNRRRVRKNIFYAVDPPLGVEDKLWPESRCVSESDAVFAVTARLKDLLVMASGREDVKVLPHGVDYGEASLKFDDSLSLTKRIGIEDESIIIGYTGAIHRTCIDFDLVRSVACRRVNWHFVFIGPYTGSSLNKKGFDISFFDDLKNVHFLGQLPYKELKTEIADFDICIVPYDASADVGWARRSPFKILSYLAQGKPVLMSNVPAANDYLNLIYVYKDDDSFIAQVERVINEDCRGNENRRKEFAEQHDFKKLKIILEEEFLNYERKLCSGRK